MGATTRGAGVGIGAVDVAFVLVAVLGADMDVDVGAEVSGDTVVAGLGGCAGARSVSAMLKLYDVLLRVVG